MLRYTKQNNCLIAAILFILATVAYQAYGPQMQGLQAPETNASNRPPQARIDELDKHKWRPENVLDVSGEEAAPEVAKPLEWAYMHGIKGEVDVQITPDKKGYFGETLPSVVITGPDMEEWKMDGMQVLALYPSLLSRGFYIQECSSYTGDIEVKYIGYRNQIMDKSQQWTQIDQYSGCNVSRVRGVNYLLIGISADKQTPGTIKITEEKWLYTSEFKWFFRLIIALVVMTQLNALYRTQKVQNMIRKIRGQTPLSEDDFAKLADEESGQAQATGNDDNYQQDKKDERRNYSQYKQLFYKWCVISTYALNAFTKIMYLLFVSKYSWVNCFALWIAFCAPSATIFTRSVKYGKNTRKESAVITAKYMCNLLDISQLKEQWKEQHEELEKLVKDLPRLIIVSYTFGYSLELLNDIMIGQNWSWVQVASLILTVYLLVYPFIKRQSLNPVSMKYMTLSNVYILTVTLAVMYGVFHKDVDMPPPEWAKDMPNIGMGHTWIS